MDAPAVMPPFARSRCPWQWTPGWRGCGDVSRDQVLRELAAARRLVADAIPNPRERAALVSFEVQIHER